MFDLREVVIITGAASGIGRAITLKSLESGASVIACDINECNVFILGFG